MLFDLVETFQKRRRLLFVAVFLIIDFWLLIFCNQMLQSHRSDINARIQNAQQPPTLSDIGDMSANLEHSLSGIEVHILRGIVAATDGITKVERSTQTAAQAALDATGSTIASTMQKTNSSVVSGVQATGQGLITAGQVMMLPSVALSQGVGHVLGAASGLTNNQLASVIQPKKNIEVPVITPEQAHQAYLIQNGTLDVKPIKPIGSGGACDNGAGNGGYPMEWCDKAMDSVQTVSYSSDRINRECTSYAYWYFTTAEGHSDFHVTGNANRWAATSNYPVHKAPAVGAIAVETDGAFGHVAIVQALPGQEYEGKTVPPGYVLVSEMNYDWQGHFRYSYSPVNKFSAYIYP
jgi:surface antigen